jgi:hypothetical protein
MEYVLVSVADWLISEIVIILANHDSVVYNRHWDGQHGLEQDAVVAQKLRENQVKYILLAVLLYLTQISTISNVERDLRSWEKVYFINN